jgi:hypothetical protein
MDILIRLRFRPILLDGAPQARTFPLAVWATFVLLSLAIAFVSLQLNGPFVFGDEAAYFELGRGVGTRGFSGAQYNPLYPLILAGLFQLDSIFYTVFAAKLFNAVAFSSGVFPYYLIARRLIPDRRIATIAAVLAITMPLGALSLVFWAEPVYYTLVAWCIALFLAFSDSASTRNSLLLGLALALAFFAKQAALLLIPALALAFAWDASHTPRDRRPDLVWRQVVTLAVGAGLPLAWIARNRLEAWGGGGVGYQDSWRRLTSRLSEPGQFALDSIVTLFNSLGYSALTLYGVFMVVFLTAVSRPAPLGRREKMLAIVLAIVLTELLLLTSVFHAVYESAAPLGRYLDAVLPTVLIFAIAIIHGGAQLRRSSIAWFALAVGVLVLAFSPLDYLFAYSFMNNAGISYLHQFFAGPGEILWTPYRASGLEKIAVSLIAAVMVGLALIGHRPLLLYAVLAALQVSVSVCAYWNILKVGRSQVVMNDMFRALATVEALQAGESRRTVVIDEAYAGDEINGFYRFWKGGLPTYVDPSSLISQYRFDLGLWGLPPPPGWIKVPAPWRAEARYDKGFRGFGFLDIANLEATDCGLKRPGASLDWVASTKTGRFLLDLPPGDYRVRISADTRGCGGVRPFSFVVTGHDGQSLDIDEYSFDRSFSVSVGESGLSLTFMPRPSGIWGLDMLEVTRVAADGAVSSYGRLLLVSKRKLPFPEVTQSASMRVYLVN